MSLASVSLGWVPPRGISWPKGGHVLHGSSWFGMPSGAAGPGHRGTSSGESHLPAPLPPPPRCSTPFVALCTSPSPWCLGPSLSQPSKPDGFPSCLPAVPPASRKEENTRSLVNDKREVAEQRQRYEQYSVVVEEVGGPGPPGRGEPATPGPSGPHSCHCRCPYSLARACPTAVTTTRTSTMTRTMATRWALTMPTRMMSSSAAGEAAGR